MKEILYLAPIKNMFCYFDNFGFPVIADCTKNSHIQSYLNPIFPQGGDGQVFALQIVPLFTVFRSAKTVCRAFDSHPSRNNFPSPPSSPPPSSLFSPSPFPSSRLSVCLSACLSVCPSVRPSVRLSVRPSVLPFVLFIEDLI